MTYVLALAALSVFCAGGEWVGLCKLDKEGKARKVVGCSCVVVKDWGEENEGHFYLKEYIKKNKK